MQDRYSIFLIFIIAVLVTQDVYCHSTETYPILMPNVKPYQVIQLNEICNNYLFYQLQIDYLRFLLI